ncbi:hypothetical protein NMY22_g14282 [Coprinellus aureogranulatus]|nr:hypothetical protein NMY22_g14282 [Coprinellus aureogranulatus]
MTAMYSAETGHFCKEMPHSTQFCEEQPDFTRIRVQNASGVPVLPMNISSVQICVENGSANFRPSISSLSSPISLQRAPTTSPENAAGVPFGSSTRKYSPVHNDGQLLVGFHPEDPLHESVRLWIWGQVVQEKLDDIVRESHTHWIRFTTSVPPPDMGASLDVHRAYLRHSKSQRTACTVTVTLRVAHSASTSAIQPCPWQGDKVIERSCRISLRETDWGPSSMAHADERKVKKV